MPAKVQGLYARVGGCLGGVSRPGSGVPGDQAPGSVLVITGHITAEAAQRRGGLKVTSTGAPAGLAANWRSMQAHRAQSPATHLEQCAVQLRCQTQSANLVFWQAQGQEL